MKTREQEFPGYNPDLQRAWREALNIPIRSPRTGYEDVQRMLLDSRAPRVFMRERSKTTEVVVRLNFSSAQLSRVLRAMYFGSGINLPMVFDQVLSKTGGKGRSTFGWELSTLGYNAYCQAWIHLFEILYLNRLHPAVNPPSWLAQFKNNLVRKRGRHRQENTESFKKRFKFFEKHCRKLRASIKAVTLQGRSGKVNTFVTAADVKKRLWRGIAKLPGGVSILGGEAFLLIPYGKRNKRGTMENLQSWTPRQLAIALLALESDLKYQTVEKKVAGL
jgi:hypothetical protein